MNADTRVQPPRCELCGATPTLCGSCGDYACRCPLPWMAINRKKYKIIPRVHYQRNGRPYPPPAGFDPSYPDEDADIKWLIEGGFT